MVAGGGEDEETNGDEEGCEAGGESAGCRESAARSCTVLAAINCSSKAEDVGDSEAEPCAGGGRLLLLLLLALDALGPGRGGLGRGGLGREGALMRAGLEVVLLKAPSDTVAAPFGAKARLASRRRATAACSKSNMRAKVANDSCRWRRVEERVRQEEAESGWGVDQDGRSSRRQATGSRLQAASYRQQVAGSKLQAAGCGQQVAGSRLQVAAQRNSASRGPRVESSRV